MTPILADQHVYGFEGTGAESIFIIGFIGLFIAAAFAIRLSFKHWIIAGTLFATALTAGVDFDKMAFVETWMLPVQQARAEIHLAFGIILTLLVLLPGRIGLQHASFQSMILMIMGLYMAILQFVHAGPDDGFKSLGFALATIPCMLVAIPHMTRTREQCVLMLKTIMMVSVVWTICCSVQFVIQPKYLVNSNGRFLGMLGNAQHASAFIAPLCVVALWLVLNESRKFLWITLLAINLLFLMWTGSRNGAMMFLLGAGGVLYARGGRTILFLPIGAVVFIGLYYLSNLLQIGSNVERLVSGEDTRSNVWTVQIATALAHPLFGVGPNENIGGSESSYLAGFAAYGMGVLLLMLTLLFSSMAFCVRLIRGKRWLPTGDRALVDLFVAFNAMYFAGAAFEGYLAARSSTTLTMMFMFAGIGVYLKERIADEQAIEYANPDEYADNAFYSEARIEPDGTPAPV